jgi:hypothetical protein
MTAYLVGIREQWFDGGVIPEDDHLTDLLRHAFMERQNLNLATSLANDPAEEVRVQAARQELSPPSIGSMNVNFNVPDRQPAQRSCGCWLMPCRSDCIPQN